MSLKKTSRALLIILIFIGICGVGCRRSPETNQTKPVDLQTAARLYRTYCADCHGENGDGQGRYAEQFTIPPASFRSGIFKFKRTATGTPPTDDDIYRTLTIGARGTGMVPQLHLTEGERLGLVNYLKTLSPVFQDPSRSPQPLTLPPRPDRPIEELIQIGKTWYQRAGCVQCHGESGKGDGPAAPTLKDAVNRPVVMPDLTTTPYKQGSDATAIAWVLITGRDGTPMPSYQKALTREQLWGIAEYVVTLQKGKKPAGMMGLIGEEILAMRIDMEAVHAWRMGGMMGPMRRMMRRMMRRKP